MVMGSNFDHQNRQIYDFERRLNLKKNISFTENQIRQIESSNNHQINAEITQLHEIATKLKAELKRAEADRTERIRKVDIQVEAQDFFLVLIVTCPEPWKAFFAGFGKKVNELLTFFKIVKVKKNGL